jgi:phospho-N-acetylmuramoyl-pentapeptide-transferase
MKNWAENKIIVRFWMIAIIANLLALITLKIR